MTAALENNVLKELPRQLLQGADGDSFFPLAGLLATYAHPLSLCSQKNNNASLLSLQEVCSESGHTVLFCFFTAWCSRCSLFTIVMLYIFSTF